MFYFLIKIFLSAVLIAIISEISKRSTFIGAITMSLPLISILSFLWIYFETRDTARIAALSSGTFWLVLPSLVLFLLLPWLLKLQVNFFIALALSLAATCAAYFAMVFLLKKLGITLG